VWTIGGRRLWLPRGLWRFCAAAAAPARKNAAAATGHARAGLTAPNPSAVPPPAQVQVWDTQREAPDPAVVITEGLDAAPAARLSWDAASRLLAAGAGADALVWDVSGAAEGRVGGSAACGGLGEGELVARVAFQPNGSLLVRAPRPRGPRWGCVLARGPSLAAPPASCAWPHLVPF
jgi:hypothetical protein